MVGGGARTHGTTRAGAGNSLAFVSHVSQGVWRESRKLFSPGRVCLSSKLSGFGKVSCSSSGPFVKPMAASVPRKCRAVLGATCCMTSADSSRSITLVLRPVDELQVRTVAGVFEPAFKTKWPPSLRAVPAFVAVANQPDSGRLTFGRRGCSTRRAASAHEMAYERPARYSPPMCPLVAGSRLATSRQVMAKGARGLEV